MKCKVVETLRNLVKNVVSNPFFVAMKYVNYLSKLNYINVNYLFQYAQHAYFVVNPESCSLFLQQKPLLNSMKLFDETVAKVAENLILSGLTAHSLNPVFLYESLAFYEEVIVFLILQTFIIFLIPFN